MEKTKTMEFESVPRKSIWQKMSDIQGLNIQINKDKQAHGYAYATLDQIMDKLAPILHENKLLVLHQTDWDTEEKCSYLKTTVVDTDDPTQTISSLTYLDSTVTLPGQNKVMVIGSMITYYRRYHVTSLFGLTTETDTDAGGALPGKKSQATGSVEAAGGGEKAVDFEAIFKNMIAKGKAKDVVQKQFDNYKSKMTEEQVTLVTALISEIK